MERIASLQLELVRQVGNWEPCAGCPAGSPGFERNSLCHYLSGLANEKMGGFASCGGGTTWQAVAAVDAFNK